MTHILLKYIHRNIEVGEMDKLRNRKYDKEIYLNKF